MLPNKLKAGDQIRVVAPSRSMSIIPEDVRKTATFNLEKLGLKVSFGKHVEENDSFNSSSTKSRLADLHDAFADPQVKGVFTVIGGFNSNQLLNGIDWDLIKKNPKIFCGLSDITVLSNAIYAKTDLVTYSGMHYSTFGQKILQDYNVNYFKRCLIESGPFEIKPSEKWSNDSWYKNQDARKFMINEGWWILNEGSAKGISVGGNLSSFKLLFGTEYMPNLKNSILFLEDDNFTTNDVNEFDRQLQALMYQKNFKKVRALLIGRFEIGSGITRELLTKIIASKQELKNVPVIANIDFGHTDPMITFPIGGEVKLNAQKENSFIGVLKH